MDPAFKVWAIQLANVLIRLVDFALDLLLSWTFSRGTRKERYLARISYEHSAQLVSVVARADFVPTFPMPWNTASIFKHERYISPRKILEDDNICLSHVDEKEAFFVIADQGVNLYDTSRFPFMSIGMYQSCPQYIRLPLSSFHRLAEEVGNPTVKLGVCAITARCGSTLLSQVMNLAPGTRSLAEPLVFPCIWFLFYWGKIDREEQRQLLRSSVRILLKTNKKSDFDRVFLKLDGFSNQHLGILHELFPEATFILSTRHPVPSIKSFRWKIDQS